MKAPALSISRTDLKRCIGLLTACASLVDGHCKRTTHLNKARQCRLLIKKLNKKLEL